MHAPAVDDGQASAPEASVVVIKCAVGDSRVAVVHLISTHTKLQANIMVNS